MCASTCLSGAFLPLLSPFSFLTFSVRARGRAWAGENRRYFRGVIGRFVTETKQEHRRHRDKLSLVSELDDLHMLELEPSCVFAAELRQGLVRRGGGRGARITTFSDVLVLSARKVENRSNTALAPS